MASCAKSLSSKINLQKFEDWEHRIGFGGYPVKRCDVVKRLNKYPSFVPHLYSASITFAAQNEYCVVSLFGDRFFPDGTTFVQICDDKGNIVCNNVSIVFITTQTVSFVFPTWLPAGVYSVQVINVYNSNFSPARRTAASFMGAQIISPEIINFVIL